VDKRVAAARHNHQPGGGHFLSEETIEKGKWLLLANESRELKRERG
jgi:hypothetical protein